MRQWNSSILLTVSEQESAWRRNCGCGLRKNGEELQQRMCVCTILYLYVCVCVCARARLHVHVVRVSGGGGRRDGGEGRRFGDGRRGGSKSASVTLGKLLRLAKPL